MKTSGLLLIFIPCAFAIADEPVIPQPFPASRYDKMLEDSPFKVKTADAPAPVVEEAPSWSANLFLGGVVNEVINGEEVATVYVGSRSDPACGFRLRGTEPGPDGIQLVSLNWSPDALKVKATIKKDGQPATIERNQADFATSSGGVAPPAPVQPQRPGGPPRPGAPGGPGAIRRPPMPSQTPIIPRPTGAQVLPGQAGQPPRPAGNPNDRKRIRVINAKPEGGG